MHGKGTYTYKDGRKYEGEWSEGFKQGQGTYTRPSGDKYEGFFRQDKFEGFGRWTSSDGQIFQGTWKENKKHGWGQLISPTGEKVEGEWKDNELDGLVIFTHTKMGTRYKEIWKSGHRTESRTNLRRTEIEMNLLLENTKPPVWAPDKDHPTCQTCQSAFSVFNRRHHCRHCGLVFCRACTMKKLPLPRIGVAEPARICDECFILLKIAEVLKPGPSSV
eukprot:TRINITY_DN1860_c0_g1_i2.p1 TRINITY_DN1860_c0_g1~~TRINITY_DN1860_c0_g1_i2.p1  ORF type:complete len:230 (-),score=0.53 TRINITY_DN1860_c0_g1_i2:112-768(-)